MLPASQVPPFPTKTFELMEDPETDGVVSWGPHAFTTSQAPSCEYVEVGALEAAREELWGDADFLRHGVATHLYPTAVDASSSLFLDLPIFSAWFHFVKPN
jgi:hypothetical protein